MRPCAMLITNVQLLVTFGVVAAQVEVPEPENFYRRALHSIAVVGNFLYLEGGRISQSDGSQKQAVTSDTGEEYDKPQDKTPVLPTITRTNPHEAVNSTLSISLKESWNNETVRFNGIKKWKKPSSTNSNLWPDTTNNILYQWGGDGSQESRPGITNASVWLLSPNEGGGGTWDVVQPASGTDDVIRRSSGADVVCGGQAYVVGGFLSTTNSSTTLESNNRKTAPGMLSFSLDSQTWTNQSLSSDLRGPKEVMQLKGACITGFDNTSMIVTTGGMSKSRKTHARKPVGLEKVRIYNQRRRRWFTQETTGAIPPDRYDHCMVGVTSPDGSFDIYVYGGRSNSPDALDDVWVLTLPGFHWMRIDISSPRRFSHACAVVGKRQMLVNGGLASSEDAWNTKDPWKQGLGILDLTEWKWSNGYDAKAKDYQSPSAIKDWYKNGGMKDVVWSSSELKEMFASCFTDDKLCSSSPSRLIAILCGALGGVAALALIAGLIYYIRRKKRMGEANRDEPPSLDRQFDHQFDHQDSFSLQSRRTHTIDSTKAGMELDYQVSPLSELPHAELPHTEFASPISELDATPQRPRDFVSHEQFARKS
ncbi:hypothetical protein QQS21_003943 [Conoideocrella luteorostrata]|uniref:Kelch repeat protein n=1 Tax=Conoideocrella luteorostrata TaxID=1105319 RepID=A0AAJ0CSJ4_9HYPO|nr:hypothetical protein QQS21_003943 [Conoideocrella luteorostrata]